MRVTLFGTLSFESTLMDKSDERGLGHDGSIGGRIEREKIGIYSFAAIVTDATPT